MTFANIHRDSKIVEAVIQQLKLTFFAADVQ